MQVQEVENNLGLQVCKKQSLVIERGEGVQVWDDVGRQYLDLTAGWGVTCLGHSHPVIVEAITQQATRIIQNPNSGFTYSPVRAQLLLELQQVLPAGLSRVFFANSGAEANDAALKIARKMTGRSKVVSLLGAFHGRTLATLTASGGPQNGAKFLPKVPGHEFCKQNDGAELAELIDDQTAAVIVELVQGEGGVRAVDAAYLRHLRALCDKHGCLLIIDEVQTGFCRTGRFFALDYYDVRADIMTMGKGIAGGLPFAAFALTEQVAASMALGDHGGTYCGNPLSCAVSLAVTRYLRENAIAERVAEFGNLVLEDLLQLQQKYPQVLTAVRGRGLMLALELAADEWVWPFTEICQQMGLLVTPTKNAVVRLLPSLLLTSDEWEQALSILDRALAQLSCHLGSQVVRTQMLG